MTKVKKLYTVAMLISLLLIVIVVTHNLWLEAMFKFLVVSDELMEANVVVILDGGDGPVYNYGVKLYKSGYVKKIILVGGPIELPWMNTSYARLTMHWIVKSLNVPEDAVMLEEKNSIDTYEIAEYIKEDMIKWNFKSAIVVGSPYHTRRAKMSFKKVFDDHRDISLMFSPAGDEQFQLHKWWTRGDESIEIAIEYCKLVLYFSKHII
jgi:uncharacterized SAM-binding protein YcdF (DUF218 family)